MVNSCRNYENGSTGLSGDIKIPTNVQLGFLLTSHFSQYEGKGRSRFTHGSSPGLVLLHLGPSFNQKLAFFVFWRVAEGRGGLLCRWSCYSSFTACGERSSRVGRGLH